MYGQYLTGIPPPAALARVCPEEAHFSNLRPNLADRELSTIFALLDKIYAILSTYTYPVHIFQTFKAVRFAFKGAHLTFCQIFINSHKKRISLLLEVAFQRQKLEETIRERRVLFQS